MIQNEDKKIDNFGSYFLQLFEKTRLKSKNTNNGHFIHPCFTHCATNTDEFWNNYTIRGKSLREAVWNWWIHQKNDQLSNDHGYIEFDCRGKVGGLDNKWCSDKCKKANQKII